MRDALLSKMVKEIARQYTLAVFVIREMSLRVKLAERGSLSTREDCFVGIASSQ
jgi:hypothetical protein